MNMKNENPESININWKKDHLKIVQNNKKNLLEPIPDRIV